MLSCDIYQAMLKRITQYFEIDNESYPAIACNLSSDVNEVSHDKILHHSVLIQHHAIKFYSTLLEVNKVSRDDIFTSLTLFCLSLLLFVTNFETNGLPYTSGLALCLKRLGVNLCLHKVWLPDHH